MNLQAKLFQNTQCLNSRSITKDQFDRIQEILKEPVKTIHKKTLTDRLIELSGNKCETPHIAVKRGHITTYISGNPYVVSAFIEKAFVFDSAKSVIDLITDFPRELTGFEPVAQDLVAA